MNDVIRLTTFPEVSGRQSRIRREWFDGYLTDTLLLCHLLEWNLEDLRDRLLHFRTGDNKEVDFVLEKPDGKLTGIEGKSSVSVSSADFKGLKVLQEALGNKPVGCNPGTLSSFSHYDSLT